jgi:hypothetical protein
VSIIVQWSTGPARATTLFRVARKTSAGVANAWPDRALSPRSAAVLGAARGFGWFVLEGIWRHKRQNLVKPAYLDRSVDRSRGCEQRQLESVAMRTLVERHE